MTKTISNQYSQIKTLTNKLLLPNKVAAEIKTEIASIKQSNGNGGWEELVVEVEVNTSVVIKDLGIQMVIVGSIVLCKCDHNSANCTTRKSVHKEEATRNNNMGGCRWYKNHRFEWPLPGKHGGYINLIKNESFCYISCIPNIETPISRKI